MVVIFVLHAGRSGRAVNMAKFPPVAIIAAEAAPRTTPFNYPEPFASRMAGRMKHPLGDIFGLTNFGVNLTRLLPGSGSALRHSHSKQDEFIYILQGNAVLISDAGDTNMSAGDVVTYPDDDIQAVLVNGAWQFMHKDGTPY